MKVNIERSNLLPTLNLVSSVVEKTQTMPMLSHIYLRMENSKLVIVASDLEVEVSETIAEVGGENGEFTISMQKIFDISRMLPEKSQISIHPEKGKAVLTSGRGRYTLKTLPANEFPRIVEDKWEDKFTISQSVLKSVLEKTAFSMAVQDVRYYLNGILFQLSKKMLRAVATDGHRLGQTDVDIKLDVKESRDVIVPRKAVNEIVRFIGGADEESNADTELTVEVSPNHLRLTKGETSIITKLIDGKFPEFKDTLEKKPDIMAVVNRAAFIDTLNRAAVLTESSDRLRGVKLNLDKGILRVTARNMDQEEAVDEMDAKYDGEATEIGFNVGYLVDVARAITTEALELHFRSTDNVCFIKQPGDKRTLWLIMPMRI